MKPPATLATLALAALLFQQAPAAAEAPEVRGAATAAATALPSGEGICVAPAEAGAHWRVCVGWCRAHEVVGVLVEDLLFPKYFSCDAALEHEAIPTSATTIPAPVTTIPAKDRRWPL